MQFRAPINDILFTLKATFDELPGLDFETAEAIVRHFSIFAEEILAPLDQVGDLEGSHLEDSRVRVPSGFVDAYRAYIGQGWPGMAIPETYGGQGLPEPVVSALSEIMSGANHAFQMMVGVAPAAARAIIIHGTQAQKQLFLPRLVSGAWLATMCLTEPDAGSDLAAIRTRGRLVGGNWRIHGEKVFISGGDQDMSEGIVHLVLARTGEDDYGVRGLSLFVCPARREGNTPNGVRVTRLEHKLGLSGSPTCALSFDDAEAELVGAEGDGLSCMFNVMNPMRIDVALQGIAHAAAAAAYSRTYAEERTQGVRPGTGKRAAIATHGDVQRMLATQDALALGGRAMAYHAIAQLERSTLLTDFLVPICKVFCSDAGWEAADLAVQVFGGYGYLREYPPERILRNVRITRIYEGTNGIHAMTLVRRMLRLNERAALKEFEGAIVQEIDNSALVNDWRHATQAVFAIDDPGIVATPYMKLSGLVTFAAAWQRLEARIDLAPEPDRIRRLAHFVRRTMLPASAMWAAMCLDPPVAE
jgi:alkylation response protein AidB-like acyl-CoA dehydrogenase